MKDDSQEAMLREIVRLAEDSEWPSTRRERIADLARELLSRMPEPPRARTEAGPYLPLVQDAKCVVCGDVQGAVQHLRMRPPAYFGALPPTGHDFVHPVDEREDIVARNLGYGDEK